MRMSREAAAETKDRIIDVAAQMLRERGYDGTSLADVMHAAGMTHGGFYKHFSSKDEMADDAVRSAFEAIAALFAVREAEAGWAAAAAAYFEDYLSPAHVENPGLGCPVAGLGADAGRRVDALGPAFRAGVDLLIERNRPKRGGAKARAKTIRRLAMLTGAVTVARAVGPGPLREEILAACQEA